MNYYQPLEVMDKATGQGTGKYHYTRTNDGHASPVGYCRGGCPGHDTPDEAREHYKEYLLDNARFDQQIENQQLRCEVCGEWTQGVATTFGMGEHILCDEHRNREGLAEVLTVGDAVSSV